MAAAAAAAAAASRAAKADGLPPTSSAAPAHRTAASKSVGVGKSPRPAVAGRRAAQAAPAVRALVVSSRDTKGGQEARAAFAALSQASGSAAAPPVVVRAWEEK